MHCEHLLLTGENTFYREKLLSVLSKIITPLFLNLHRLPFSPRKQPQCKNPHRGFGDKHTPKYAGVFPIQRDGQKVRKRDLNKPKEYDVNLGGRFCIARSVKGLGGNHPPAVNKERVREDAQPLGSYLDYVRVGRKNTHQLPAEDEIHHGNRHQKNHVVNSDFPHGAFGAIGTSGSQVLTNQCSSSI